MTNIPIDNQKVQEQETALADSVKMSRVIVPILLGLVVVVYLIWNAFDPQEFANLSWNRYTIVLFGLAVLSYVLRHIFYAERLRLVSNKAFGFRKSVELIFIWEFASTVTPTSFGGSAVAIFLLAQERISAAKSVAMVMYAVVLDTFFFIVSIPVLFLIFGVEGVRPQVSGTGGGFVVTLWTIYLFMIGYGLFLGIGILRPQIIGRFIDWLGSWKILARFREGMHKTATELSLTSKVLVTMPRSFHLRMVLFTFFAWILRFMTVVFVILGVVQSLHLGVYDIGILFSRSEMMHVITQFSPTPGGAGIAEGMFGGFFADYIPTGVASVIALIWRIITYYTYLFIGIVIIPNWLRRVMRRRKRKETES